MATQTHRTIDAVWRIESARLIAGLTRIVRDVGVAEDLAQDALVAALEKWPTAGVPDNPGAWLTATAKHRAIDLLRRAQMLERHARTRTAEDTDWKRIASLYDALAERVPSPVVALNRAVAVGMAFGPAAGLELVDSLTTEPALENYHLLPAVRGDLLAKLGRDSEAREEFERAASLTRNARERDLLLERARKGKLRRV